ncbi:MAG: hypothetical protein HKO64_11335 [Xanthomonadales bacterium]|nr:hypothetical protein [Gammaproteobacteria bacterium]NNE04769.1 hypothetical protein [Xanthomonadales bacterium]NNL96205.1 hypothetical protein [Xanthomonadales bacterium]
MKPLIKTLILSAMLCAGIAQALQTQEPATQGPPAQDPDFDFESNKLDFDKLEQDVREAELRKRQVSPPDMVPQGWLADFDYQSDLNAYLQSKVQAAASDGKETYVYLYADWLEACREFRKTADRKDYAKLFASSQIILLDYSYFRNKFNTQLSNLPIFIKAHAQGSLGPEVHRPVSRTASHPRKAFHELRKFLETGSTG